jgi:hypothetical protein
LILSFGFRCLEQQSKYEEIEKDLNKIKNYKGKVASKAQDQEKVIEKPFMIQAIKLCE